MEYIIYSLALIVIGSVVAILCAKSWSDFRIVLPLLWFSFLVRVFAMTLNEELGFLEERGAFWYTLEWTGNFLEYLNLGSERPSLTEKFALQGLINVPSSLVFGVDRINFLLTNIFIGALCPVVVYGYLRRLFNFRVASWGALLFTVYPGAFVFSIFGIRDIVLYFFVALHILALLGFVKCRTPLGWWTNLTLYCLTFVAVIILRQALIGLLVIEPLIILGLKAGERIKKVRYAEDRVVAWSLLVFLSVLPVAVIIVSAYTASIGGVTGGIAVSPIEIIEEYSENRFERAFRGENYGSMIVDRESFQNMPWYVRYVMQVIGLIIIPFPWLFNSLSRFFAAGDSAFILLCLWCVYRLFRNQYELEGRYNVRLVMMTLAIVFVASTLSMGLLINNQGNGFRMRIAILPYLLIPASFYLGQTRKFFILRYRRG